jgi:hypothetical protein
MPLFKSPTIGLVCGQKMIAAPTSAIRIVRGRAAERRGSRVEHTHDAVTIDALKA